MAFDTKASEAQFLFTVDDIEIGVVDFTSREEISAPFQVHLTLASEDDLHFDAVVSKEGLLTVMGDRLERHFHGIVSEFTQSGMQGRFHLYRATLVPSLWTLSLRHNCRIFQTKTVQDIVQQILEEAGIPSDRFAFRLQNAPQPREYCVQYRETDLNFISRLLEEEGIFYFFEHDRDKHLLVFGDGPMDYQPIPGEAEVLYRSAEMVPEEEFVFSFVMSRQMTSGKMTLQDFNFQKPSLDLKSQKQTDAFSQLEVYDYPGEYLEPAQGKKLADIRLQEAVTFAESAEGKSVCPRFNPGFTFTLAEHERNSLNQDYLLVNVIHNGSQPQTLEELAGEGGSSYSNQFVCIPASVTFRPGRNTPKPVVEGVQTAIVTGPPGEEVYTDKHGRVKVQFHWDREGQNNDKSSCWIRVSQAWAGAGWGAMFIPRIGHEVIVDFIEGDPDRPIITGRVYHGTNIPPYALPDDKTRSTIKSDSSVGGGGFNELRFEDKSGAEEVYLHAEKDWNIQVKNCESETVGANISTNAGASISRGAGKDISRTADDNIIDKAGKNMTAESGKNMNLKAGGSYQLWTNLGIHLKAMNFVAALIESGAKKAAEAIKKGAAQTATQTAAAGAQAGATGGAATGAAGSQLASGGETTGMQALAALSPGIEAGAAELTRLSNQAADRADQLNEPVNRAIEASDQLGRAIESGASPEAIAESAMALADASSKAFGDAQKLVEEMLPQIPSIVMWAMKDINARALWSMNFSTKVKDMSFNAENKDINVKAKQNLNLEAETKDLNVKAGKENVLITGKKKVHVNAEEDKMVIEAGKEKIFVKSPKQIFLKCGSASISMAKSGNIVIKGAKINIKGSGPVQVKGKPIKMN